MGEWWSVYQLFGTSSNEIQRRNRYFIVHAKDIVNIHNSHAFNLLEIQTTTFFLFISNPLVLLPSFKLFLYPTSLLWNLQVTTYWPPCLRFFNEQWLVPEPHQYTTFPPARDPKPTHS